MIPRLHLVTDDAVLADARFVDRARAVLEAGAAAVALHIRGPRTPTRGVFEVARELRASAGGLGSLLLVNDRVDVALALGLGVHLGERSMPLSRVRTLMPAGAVIGRSVHGPGTGGGTAGGGADFVFAGPVFPSASHPGAPGGGPGLVQAVARTTEVPVLGIGGVSPDRVVAVLRAGGYGVAVLSGVWGAPRSGRAVEAYLEALASAGAGIRAERGDGNGDRESETGT